MRRFFPNKFTFTVLLSLFALPFAIAGHGPTVSPDPWAGFAALHGPTMPPDPWAGDSGHGPTMPPDPWAGDSGHGPTMPPDPWAGLA